MRIVARQPLMRRRRLARYVDVRHELNQSLGPRLVGRARAPMTRRRGRGRAAGHEGATRRGGGEPRRIGVRGTHARAEAEEALVGVTEDQRHWHRRVEAPNDLAEAGVGLAVGDDVAHK